MQHDTDEEISRQELVERLQWVKYRARILEITELKLLEMKQIAEYAKDNELSRQEAEVMNSRLRELSYQIKCLDEESRIIQG